MVMVDQNNKLVDVYFYVNCGGQISELDYIWNFKVFYFNLFWDIFCIYICQVNWEKCIFQNDWCNYLVDIFYYFVEDIVIGLMIFNFV